MRIALIYSRDSYLSAIKDMLFRLPEVECTPFLLIDGVLFTQDGEQLSLHDIALWTSAYILDPNIPHQIKENIHHYFDAFAVPHLYGQTHLRHNAAHDFLVSKVLEIQDGGDDIERALVDVWTTLAHPVRVRRKENTSSNISSIHELRRQTLPHMMQGERIECVYQPKGRRLACTLVRHARGKKVYTSPLFEKITHDSGDKLSSAALSIAEKENIIRRLEKFFEHYPTFPTLHVELMYTPKGIYLMDAMPIQNIDRAHIPDTLHAIGMQPHEIITSCLTLLSTK